MLAYPDGAGRWTFEVREVRKQTVETLMQAEPLIRVRP